MISLVRLELAVLRRDPRAWWALVCVAALVLIAFAATTVETSRSDRVKESVAAAERARWVGQGEKDPHSAAHYSIFAFKPSPPLSALDTGAEPFVGQSVWLEAHHQNDMLYRPRQNASLLQRPAFGSPAALITGVGPLVVFLLAFALVAQDRERGGLRLALGAADHPGRIVQAKAVAVWTAATGLLVLPVALAALGWTVFSGRLSADTALRLLAWSGVMAIYLGVLSALAVAVSLWAKSARVALAGLFGVWIVLALIVPRLGSGAVEAAHPLPSSQSIRQQMADEAPAYWSDAQSAKNRATLMARHGVSRYEDIRNPRIAELDLMERHSHEVFDRVLGGFYAKVAEQDRLFAALGVLSPAVSAQVLSASTAASDFSHHRDFIDFAERYRRELVNAMNADGMAHRALGAERHVNDESLWSSIPPFAYTPPRLGGHTETAAPALFALLLWLGLALIALRVAARRLQP